VDCSSQFQPGASPYGHGWWWAATYSREFDKAPKGGELAVAKFPRNDDEWPVTRWEAVALSLAAAAGIHVPKFRLEQITKKAVLLLHRFDRHAATRIPFMSAMTALSADDSDLRSYLELAEVLRREGSRAKLDLQELWRRMTFNVLISNTDDHLRNHGFLHDGNGWRLAPAYDLNPMPMPTDVRPRVHALALDETDQTSSLDTALRVAPMFGLNKTEARTIARQVASSVRKWGSVGTKLGLGARQLARMESAFEHDDLTAAAK
jgi:serine/threonine-protein kinase HipA